MKNLHFVFLILLFSNSSVLAEDKLADLVAAGQKEQAIALIKDNTNVNLTHSDGTSALMYAAYQQDAELVNALLKAGAEANQSNSYGASAISEAAIGSANEILALLLEYGADPNWQNPEGETPLMVTARAGNVEGSRLLLEHGADINATERWGGQTALMWAAAQSQPEVLQLLVDHGAELDLHSTHRVWDRRIMNEPRPKDLNKGGFTALQFAARQGCAACISVLANAGADLNAHDPDRVTALNLALMNLHFDTAAALIEAGADVNKWDHYGRSPLFNALDLNTLPIGGRPDIPSTDKLTGYDIAVMLLERGANPNRQLTHLPPYRNAIYDRGSDKVLEAGATPLMRAAKGGDIPAVNLLLEHGALADLPNEEGQTPLMVVAGIGHTTSPTRGKFRTQEQSIELIRILLDAGADINAVSGDPAIRPGQQLVNHDRGKHMHAANEGEIVVWGQTALHGAAKQGWTEVARFLIDNGARQQVIDDSGRTPFDYAMGNYPPAYNDSAPLPFFETAQFIQESCQATDNCVMNEPLQSSN